MSVAAFNAWWYWRDTRPLSDGKTIALWMNRQQYDLAEPELRERLRRSPHDAESMAGAIDKVLSSSSERTRLVEYGNERVQDFSFQSLGMQLEHLYRSVISEGLNGE